MQVYFKNIKYEVDCSLRQLNRTSHNFIIEKEKYF